MVQKAVETEAFAQNFKLKEGDDIKLILGSW